MTARIINKPTFFPIIGRDPYNLINLILAGIILCIFLYSSVFSPLKNNYPFISFYDSITGQESISSGLSRGFSSIMGGQFSEAANFNIYSIRIFSFFLIQFIMRCFAFFVTWRKCGRSKTYITFADISVSIGLFIIFFFPFLKDAFA
jgi:Ca2+/H+ antiporter